MTPRKRLGTLGERGKLARLILETRYACSACKTSGVSEQWLTAHAERCQKRPAETKRYVVQSGPKDAREQESFPYTKAGRAEAESYFKAFGDELDAAPAKKPTLTVREVWSAYLTAESKHLRPNTIRLYTDAWRTWEQFIKPTTLADAITIQQLHEYRAALDGRGLATATVQDAIRNVRIVFNWAERMELVAVNKWHLFIYKVAKEKRTKPRAEYRSDEFLKMWAALNPEKPGQWRAWIAVGLLGIYGNRPTELLNLRWSWIKGDIVDLDPAFVKTGEEGALRLFPLTKAILAVARRWRHREAYSGDYVLFSGQQVSQRDAAGANPTKLPHYSLQSLTDQIHRAERRAGVEVIKWRAGHAFRRGLVGDLADETGDIMLALQAIRDRDIRMASRYRSRREDKIDRAVRSRAERLIPDGVSELPASAEESIAAAKAASDGGPSPSSASLE